MTKPSQNIAKTDIKPLQNHMQTNVKLFVQTECKLLSNLDQTKIRLGAFKEKVLIQGEFQSNRTLRQNKTQLYH
jgi:hypothetical protein